MRTARVVLDPTHEETDWSRLSIEAVRTQLLELLKIGTHHGLLFILKVWIKTSYFLKRTDRSVRNKITHLLHRNGHYPEGGRPSNFLKRISEHKNAITGEQKSEVL